MRSKLTASLCALALAGLVLPTVATARERSGTAQIQTDRGSATVERQVTAEDGTRTVNQTTTFEDGRTITRNGVTSCDRVAQSCTGTQTVTGPNGGGRTTETSRARTETGSTYSRDTTFSDGTTRAIDRTATRTGDNTAVIDRTVTGRNGDVRNQTATVSGQRGNRPHPRRR